MRILKSISIFVLSLSLAAPISQAQNSAEIPARRLQERLLLYLDGLRLEPGGAPRADVEAAMIWLSRALLDTEFSCATEGLELTDQGATPPASRDAPTESEIERLNQLIELTIQIHESEETPTETDFPDGRCRLTDRIADLRQDYEVSFAVSIENTLAPPLIEEFLRDPVWLPSFEGLTRADLGLETDWLSAAISDAEIALTLARSRDLVTALAAQDAQVLYEHLQALEDLETFLAFARHTQEFFGYEGLGNLPAEAPDLSTLSGCWWAGNGRMQLDIDGPLILAVDEQDDYWVGTTRDGTLLLRLLFTDDYGAYHRRLLAFSGGVSSPELDTISEVLFDAGVEHHISVTLPPDLGNAQTMDGQYYETLVAEPIIGTDPQSYQAIEPSQAQHGSWLNYPYFWARMPSC